MKIGGLFSGIGGLELGLEAAGLGETVWQIERDPFCLAVLARHWPTAQRFTDVSTATNLPPVDLLCGGFPCQDVSSAGRRAGLAGDRSGLWFEYARIIESVRPRAVVVENVTSGERAWLPRVAHDLSALGFRIEAWRLGACDVGAPHRRMRTFVLGYAHDEGQLQQERPFPDERRRPSHAEPSVGNADGPRLEKRRSVGGDARAQLAPLERADSLAHPDRIDGREQPREGARPRGATVAPLSVDAGATGEAISVGPMGRIPHGLPSRLDGHRWPAGRGEDPHPWEPERAAARGEIPQNAARLKALGNAVVPQVARLVGLRLKQILETQ